MHKLHPDLQKLQKFVDNCFSFGYNQNTNFDFSEVKIMYFYSYYDTKENIMKITEVEKHYFSNFEFTRMYNARGIYKQLFDSLKECLNNFSNYSKPIIYNGKNVNRYKPDIFIEYSNGCYYQRMIKEN